LAPWIPIFIEVKSWIRIRIGTIADPQHFLYLIAGLWIRIRIQNADPDSDPGPTQVGKIKEFSFFEVLDVLF
jgi:hypothetical protein